MESQLTSWKEEKSWNVCCELQTLDFEQQSHSKLSQLPILQMHNSSSGINEASRLVCCSGYISSSVLEGYFKPPKRLSDACRNFCSPSGNCHRTSTASSPVWRNEAWSYSLRAGGRTWHVKDHFKHSCLFLNVFLFRYWLNWDEQTGVVF